jgi:RND family efflux transporter MFP subunit
MTKTINLYTMKSKILSVALILLIFAGACNKSQKDSETQKKEAELNKLLAEHDALQEKINKLKTELGTKQDSGTRVAVEPIKLTEFNHFIEVQARVDADQSVDVYAEGVGGMVNQIMVKEGQAVNKGQYLAKLDDKVLQESLKSTQANLDFAKAMYEKQKALWEQKIGSEAQYLQIKSQKESLESSVAALKEQIDMAYIKAPVSGTVEEVAVKVGSLVGPGIAAFRVVNLSSLKVIADVAESYTSRVNKGDKVIVVLPDLKKEVEGVIDYSSKYINRTNRTFQVGVRLTSFDKDIKANMVAVLKIKDYSSPKAIVVPINAVQSDLKGYYVAVAKKNGDGYVVEHKNVSTGETYKGLIEIVSGLNQGDLLITSGYLDTEKGQAINF